MTDFDCWVLLHFAGEVVDGVLFEDVDVVDRDDVVLIDAINAVDGIVGVEVVIALDSDARMSLHIVSEKEKSIFAVSTSRSGTIASISVVQSKVSNIDDKDDIRFLFIVGRGETAVDVTAVSPVCEVAEAQV